jgi:hypothetical protein
MYQTTGVDFCLDVHAEEELSYVFLSKTPTGVPSWTPHQQDLYDKYIRSLVLCGALIMDQPQITRSQL